MYLYLKSLHLISMIAWFAGLFYIFRLFVYHIEATEDSVKETLATMEHKLIKVIMNPAMLATLAFGIALIVQNPSVMKGKWLHIKLLFVMGLMGYHMYSGKVRKQLAAGECKLTSKQARIINEVPTIVLIVAVALAVIKPF